MMTRSSTCDRCGAMFPRELPTTVGDELMQTICLGCAYRRQGQPAGSR